MVISSTILSNYNRICETIFQEVKQRPSIDEPPKFQQFQLLLSLYIIDVKLKCCPILQKLMKIFCYTTKALNNFSLTQTASLCHYAIQARQYQKQGEILQTQQICARKIRKVTENDGMRSFYIAVACFKPTNNKDRARKRGDCENGSGLRNHFEKNLDE